MPQPKQRILVVTADAGKARLFECARLGGPLRQVVEKGAGSAPAPARDRPVRVHDRFGSGRHAVEPRRSPRTAAAERFFAEVAEAVAKEKFDALVLCAPSKALGLLRRQLPDEIGERVILAAAKDYLRETPANLAKRLQELAIEAREHASR
ncbi:MAG: host attachment protein [Hyphomonadaceae bacterium]